MLPLLESLLFSPASPTCRGHCFADGMGDVADRKDKERFLLEFAKRGNDENMIEILDEGIPVDHRDGTGMTALIWAARLAVPYVLLFAPS